MTQKNWLQTFTRSRDDYWIGGVCGGLGEHTPVPSWTWRLIFALLVIIYGTGLLIYILMWFFVPPKSQPKDEQ
ncbi:MAG: hypothetical protein A2W27_07770 [Deltaproteobacteria bacterium RBG_16_44_11]|nr:MAG: hypothetical protein A2W27_07770 [Deltaproteobacteria bacterium RBG_16_44_11]